MGVEKKGKRTAGVYTNKHWPVGGSIDAGFAVPTGGRIEEH